MSPQKKCIAILVEDQYQVLEVWYPILRLKENNIDVKVIGSGTKQTYPSKEGYPVNVHASIDQVKSKDFDGVIIPGGFAPDFMRRKPAMAEFIREIHDQGKVVASICHGGWMLVSAKILKGRKATSFFAIRDDMEAAGAKWVDEEVVVDKNLITSRKPEDLTAFVVEIIKNLNNK